MLCLASLADGQVIASPVTFIDGDGGVIAPASFDHPKLVSPDPDNPNAGIYSRLANNEQASMALSGLDPNTEYLLSGEVYVSPTAGFAFQFAVLDGTDSIAAVVLTTVGNFDLVFTTPADTSNLTLHLSGDGNQFGMSGLGIRRRWEEIGGPVTLTHSSRGTAEPHASRNPSSVDATHYRRNLGASNQEWLLTFGQAFDRIIVKSVVNATLRRSTWEDELIVGVNEFHSNQIHISGGPGVVDVRFKAERLTGA